MIIEVDHPLPTGVTLRVREHGRADAPVVMLLHGFPEGAFAWDEVATRLADAGYRCVAPYLRGFGPSSHPEQVEAYRISEVAGDVAALAAIVSPDAPLAALVAHDWGGAAAWALGARAPGMMQRLAILNSPHPGAFLRDLQHDPTQADASEYMNALAAPDGEQRFSEDGYRRLWRFFESMGAAETWLDDDTRAQYIELWDQGLTGGLNYYRATPVRPGPHLAGMELPRAILEVGVPTLVIWGLLDHALLPGLADGLEEWVTDLRVERLPDASHWLAHEQPDVVADLLLGFLAS